MMAGVVGTAALICVPLVLIRRAGADGGLVTVTWLVAILLGFGSTALTFASEQPIWWVLAAAAGLIGALLVARRAERRTPTLVAVGVLGAGAPIAILAIGFALMTLLFGVSSGD
jgi:hypothetical protein